MTRPGGLVGLLVVLLLAACAASPPPPDPRPGHALRVATHNVHLIRTDRARGPWSLADWEARRHALDAVFKAADADLIAFQEMVSLGPGPDRTVNLARDWLLSRNPGYALAASGDWRSFPNRQPIFYRADRLRLRDQGWFFNDQPEVLERARARPGFWLFYTSWAEFDDAAGRVLRVYNVHFHHLDPARRRHAARTVAAHAAPHVAAGTSVIVLGDTNALPGSGTLRPLAGRGLRLVDPRGSTFHFDRGLDIFGPIDRFALGPGIRVFGGPWVLRGRHGGAWPSDHYPVVADLVLP